MFALDTNTLIYFFKGAGGVGDRLLSTPPSEIAIPAVVVYELEAGISHAGPGARRRAQLDAFLSTVRILPFDMEAAKRAADVAQSLRKPGITIGAMDTLIAGTTLRYAATLVTHNTREFARVRGLKLEDWF